MSTFQYDKALLARYPAVVGGVILARGMTNGPTPDSLLSAYQAEQEKIKRQIGTTALSQIAALAAWRNAFRGFGIDPTQYRSAAEALLRRLSKKGDIPSINVLVDLGNLVSIRYALPVAVFDTSTLQGAVSVHFANGSERYMTLGQSEEEHPTPGEVVFSDASGMVIARRWCWRQSETSAAQVETSNAIITVEAQHTDGPARHRSSPERSTGTTQQICGRHICVRHSGCGTSSHLKRVKHRGERAWNKQQTAAS